MWGKQIKSGQRRPPSSEESETRKAICISWADREQVQGVVYKKPGQWRQGPYPQTLRVIQINWALPYYKAAPEGRQGFLYSWRWPWTLGGPIGKADTVLWSHLILCGVWTGGGNLAALWAKVWAQSRTVFPSEKKSLQGCRLEWLTWFKFVFLMFSSYDWDWLQSLAFHPTSHKIVAFCPKQMLLWFKSQCLWPS